MHRGHGGGWVKGEGGQRVRVLCEREEVGSERGACGDGRERRLRGRQGPRGARLWIGKMDDAVGLLCCIVPVERGECVCVCVWVGGWQGSRGGGARVRVWVCVSVTWMHGILALQ